MFSANAFEGLIICFLIHKPTIIAITFNPAIIVWVMNLRPIFYRAITMTIALRGIRRHSSLL